MAKYYKQRWQDRNGEEERERRRQWRQTTVGKFIEYTRNSKRRNIEFSLTFEEFEELTKQKCYYCNSYSVGKDYCGIDRIDSNIGYELCNCVSCCKNCNLAKNDLTYEEFKEFITKVFKNFIAKRSV